MQPRSLHFPVPSGRLAVMFLRAVAVQRESVASWMFPDVTPLEALALRTRYCRESSALRHTDAVVNA